MKTKLIILLMFVLTILAAPAFAEDVLIDIPDETQRNSIMMMNYLLTVTSEINESEHSRASLDNTYDILLNNTYPNVIDGETQDQMNFMLDTIELYRMTSLKRDRLKYMQAQEQANRIWEVVVDPLWRIADNDKKGLDRIVNAVLMTVDVIFDYKADEAEDELEYLRENWALDDAEMEALHNSRKAAFNYMVEMVHRYDLPGEYALNESAVEDLVKQENSGNVHQRIQFLESHENVYKALAYYWLLLADSYYDAGEYEKCLNAVETYLSLNVRIFRKDYDLSRVMPKAIVSAQNTMEAEAYAEAAEKYADLIADNTDDAEWPLRYFAAQTYEEIYTLTKNVPSLQKAYDIELNIVNMLVSEQKEMNAVYLAPIRKAEVPKDAPKAEKKDVDDYNRMLADVRKTELAPVSESLLLNCNFLFELCDELKISEEKREKISNILYGDGNALFLTDPLDQIFRMEDDAETELIPAGFDAPRLTLPASLVTPDSTIEVVVSDPAFTSTFTDWKVEKVSRENESDIDSFTAVYKSDSIGGAIGGLKYSENTRITVHLTVKNGFDLEEYYFYFAPEEIKTLPVLGQQFSVKFVQMSGPDESVVSENAEESL